MAWSDAARAAAAEARRRKSEVRLVVMEAHSGSPIEMSRYSVARSIRATRAMLRQKKLLKRQRNYYTAQLSNLRRYKPLVAGTTSTRKGAWER